MEQTEQPYEQWNVPVKHEFSAAEKMPVAYQRSQQIEGVKRLEEQKPCGLPGKDESTFRPQADGDQQVSQIAEIQKVLCAVMLQVNGRPNNYPRGPADLQPRGYSHGPRFYSGFGAFITSGRRLLLV